MMDVSQQYTTKSEPLNGNKQNTYGQVRYGNYVQ
ncbi:hypothetical protein PI125_g7987 [Phytophthora idaei]|nr:hypothetical protein PI125_g7987 [Phytophthora idaei]